MADNLEILKNMPRWERRYNDPKYLKKAKARRERRRAKKDPECFPEYGKYVSIFRD
jgi:hypothetical protein